jgi:predicted metal-dependent hydrolase
LTLAAIETFIRSHGDWVLAQLAAFAARSGERQLRIAEGTRLPLLGEEITVRVTMGGNRGYWQERELWLAARPEADLAMLAQRALQRLALECFRPRLAATAQQLGQSPPRLSLSSARTRWGSCSSRSGIRLNWRLIHLAPPLIDYVIAHEVAHLLEMNHSARFWAVVEQLHPAWRSSRGELQRQGAALPLLVS